ncbi:hypothetical protein [Vibrio harveyi]|uniref:hypothetical protein n=1 Tax=Vibrio harveyi TaxID=669 RepID=UPI00237DD5C7|nr:hypothetical protein [Vibrio harveyi]ELI0634457.1 hypothetical protein [Vibrio harveyi]CAK6716980.1 conserved hypothetical protein [Vibrio harveyi]
MELYLDFNLIFNATIAFLLALSIKLLLDLRLAVYAVKYLHFLPVRSLFRENPPLLKGNWHQTWDVESEKFSQTDSTSSLSKIRQFGHYCYSEFESGSATYVLFARIDRDQVIGEWFDKKDPLGYSGSLHLIIHSSSKMDGMWIGNSKTVVKVKSGTWAWHKES